MTTPPGSWPSPITAEMAVAAGRGLEAVALAGDEVWWSESRPTEGGRIVVCRRRNGQVEDLLPAPWNARTRVHEYGGTSWLPVPAAGGGLELVFTDFRDQRLYRCPIGGEPVALTVEPSRPTGLRYADLHLDKRHHRLVAVRETHRGDGTFGTVDRTLVAIPLDGSAAEDASAAVDLLAGRPTADFLAAPRLSQRGDALVWISWDHPDMPWDSTRVHLAPVDRSGVVGADQVIAGGEGISAVDPGFLPDGSILLMSDESGWWQPILVDPASGSRRSLSGLEQEFAPPLWVLGRRSWVATAGGRLLVRPDGRPALLDTFSGELATIDPTWTSVSDLAADRDGRMALVVGGDTISSQVVVLGPDGRREVLRTSSDEPFPSGYSARPDVRDFGGVHAVVYPPTHPDHRAEPGTAPVIITVHGGPTAQHSRVFSAQTAYFTSRGFAVAAVDYHGSTGYGRPYRDALKGRWADLDIDDAINVAAALLSEQVAGSALITGGSAGGLTVLGALVRAGHPFAAGTSSYGVADLVALGVGTHDFESRYLDGLIGADRAVWVDRSPLTHADRLATPVLLLQGGQDPIVTPDQAEAFAAACSAHDVPHALIVFPEEGHGFRASENRIRALEAELAFYGQVLGFATPGVPPIDLTT